MSLENSKTIEVYQNGGALKYLINSKAHDELDLEKANRKREKLNKFFLQCFASLPKGVSIFEIGSASGENAKFLKDNGFDVTASDVADDFIEEAKKLGLKTIKFNVLEDKLKESYNGLFCWRVFVHFTEKDFEAALKNVYQSLKNDGIFVFNVMNRETRMVDEEMVDFPGEYFIGAERYYHYFRKEFVDSVAEELGFKIVAFHKEGGDEENKWLVYTLQK